MARTKPRPFLDTNVIFSALYRPDGIPAKILEHHIEASITIIVSRQVLEELVATITEKKPDLLPRLRTLFTNAPPEICPDPTASEVQRARRWINPADAPILAAAMKAAADCLVTGNTRHFTQQVARSAGVGIFTPAEYLATLGGIQEQQSTNQ